MWWEDVFHERVSAVPSSSAPPVRVPLSCRFVMDLSLEPPRTIRSLCGFPDGKTLKREMVFCGFPDLRAKMSSHERIYDAEMLKKALDVVNSTRMFPPERVWTAYQSLQNRWSFSRPERTKVHAKHRLPDVNVFALPFTYIGSGMPYELVGQLPFFNLSDTQVTLLVHNVMEIILDAWVARWCPSRPLSWLQENCLEGGKITLRLDCVDFEMDKPCNRFLQRGTHGKKSKNFAHNAARVLTVVNDKQQLVHISNAAGAMLGDVEILENDGFFKRLSIEAVALGQEVDMEVICDRAYLKWSPQGKFPNLNIEKTEPEHLVEPEDKETKLQRKKAKLRRVKRSYFPGKTALYNINTARRRARSEHGNRRLRTPKLLIHKLPPRLAGRADAMLKLTQGLGCMRAGVKPEGEGPPRPNVSHL